MDERKEIKKFAPSNKEHWEDLVRKKMSDIKYECPTSFYQESMLFIKRRIQFKRLRLICSSAAVLFVILGISFWIERQNQEMVRKKASQESIEQIAMNNASAQNKEEKKNDIVQASAYRGVPLSEKIEKGKTTKTRDSVSSMPLGSSEQQSIKETTSMEEKNKRETAIMTPAQMKENWASAMIDKKKRENFTMSTSLFTSGNAFPHKGNAGSISGLLAENGLLANPSHLKISHGVPIEIGVSFGLDFNERVSLNSGFSYRFVSSKIEIGDDVDFEKYSEFLHSIPITFHVGYAFSNHGRWRLSALAGIKMDIPIYCTRENENKHEVKKLQGLNPIISPSFLFGIEYKLGNSYGIYLSPGIKYNLTTSFSKSSWYEVRRIEPELQIGLRFQIKK